MTKFDLKKFLKSILVGLGISAWVVFSFYFVQIVLIVLVRIYNSQKLPIPDLFYNQIFSQTIASIAVYVSSLAMVIFVPYLLFKKKTTKKEMGLQRKLPVWRDLALAPAGYILAIVINALVVTVIVGLVPGFNPAQKQDIGFDQAAVGSRLDLLAVFFSLSVLAPIAEELLFRGYLFGKIRKHAGAVVTIVVTGLVFGFMHLGLINALLGMLDYDKLQWNVLIITSTLGLILGFYREYTKSVWAGILLHMLQNTVSFTIIYLIGKTATSAYFGL